MAGASFLRDKDVPPAPPSAERLEAEAISRLHFLLPRLSDKLRDVFVLCALEERSYEETAAVLAIPVGTVRSRLNKARLTLRQLYFEA